MFGGTPQHVSYGCTALVGTGKKGLLRPDSDGYYTIPVGGLNMHNASGAYYPLAPARQLFEASSSLQRRIKNGCLKGECGHPRKVPGMNMRDFMTRVLDIYEPNVCCHFRRLWLEADSVKDRNGRYIVAIMAELKPSGPMGPALKEALENPSENVCFSIRSLTNDQVSGGKLVKNLKTIITFDWVTEPGIHTADRWHAPGLESFDETQVDLLQLAAMRDRQHQAGVSLESSGNTVSLDEVLNDFGFEARIDKPLSSAW